MPADTVKYGQFFYDFCSTYRDKEEDSRCFGLFLNDTPWTKVMCVEAFQRIVVVCDKLIQQNNQENTTDNKQQLCATYVVAANTLYPRTKGLCELIVPDATYRCYRKAISGVAAGQPMVYKSSILK